MRTTPTTAPHPRDHVVNDRYRLLDPIGAGGMSTVYRAQDLHTGQEVAIKILDAKYVGHRDVVARFEVEARSMMEIDHRNVLPVYDVSTDGGEPYIAMEFASAGSLADWVAQFGPMPPRMAVGAMIQVCKGVAAAHATGIVHRDIKSHNVLISRRGVCRVSDFGIAQTDFSFLTKTGLALGTLGFMAPEQRKDAKHVGPAADIYALGATLFHLLTGRMASDLFVADQEPHVLKGVPELLKPVLIKATRYQPADRYASATDLARALFSVRETLDLDPPGTPRLAAGAQFGDIAPSDPGAIEDGPTSDTGPTMEKRGSVPSPPEGLNSHVPMTVKSPSTPPPMYVPPSQQTAPNPWVRTGLFLGGALAAGLAAATAAWYFYLA